NKLVIIDGKVVLISSINFSQKAFTENREAGIIVQSTPVANYYASIFNADWIDGEIPPSYPSTDVSQSSRFKSLTLASNFPSHTQIPLSNFTGTYNVSLFANPDSADAEIFKYLTNATSSIYVSMYTISRPKFNDTLIDLKKQNPTIDIQVLLSYNRVGSTENEDTYQAAKSLTENWIPVYNSTQADTKVDGYYHNKYWIIDGKHTFVYSGNWSPKSVSTPKSSYASGDPNRDMGIAVLDAPDIAGFYKNVWSEDVAVATLWGPVANASTPSSDISTAPLPIITIFPLIGFIMKRLNGRKANLYIVQS
ncbi:MAG TPA: phospholipase D-like domain-containing protein, partial [Candidatus Hodarchaeales archaeon]|nr:phospholipase D-like domain-containing protein [Candidatus Hodarchaeales archaeon]